MIAMAIANNPKVLIADEPTTAVDVTIQAQLLAVLRVAKQEAGGAAVVITHDFGVVSEIADRVVVMYAGKVVETGPVGELLRAPRHPYTAGLLRCLPRLDSHIGRLSPIPGSPPDLIEIQHGCAFQPRCEMSAGRTRCIEVQPELQPVGEPGMYSRCHFAAELPEWRAHRDPVLELPRPGQGQRLGIEEYRAQP
jgi:oligopeptide/dipeptide ABC transporter ATP-binding protein